MLDKQDQTVTEIRNLSTNMHDMMDIRFNRLEGEIRLIKEKIGIWSETPMVEFSLYADNTGHPFTTRQVVEELVLGYLP